MQNCKNIAIKNGETAKTEYAPDDQITVTCNDYYDKSPNEKLTCISGDNIDGNKDAVCLRE